jgi:hypothetical protein
LFAQRIGNVVEYVGVELQALHITNLAESESMALARALHEASHGVYEAAPDDNDYPERMDPRIVGARQLDIADVQPGSDWELTDTEASDADAFKQRKARRLRLRRRDPKFSETGERL